MSDKEPTVPNSAEPQINELKEIYIQPKGPMAGVREPMAIFLPKTMEDVSRAVKASQGQVLRFASGFQPAAGNDRPGPDISVVINLAQIAQIIVDKAQKKITVGVAAKLGELAKVFGKGEGTGLALPLGDNPHQSVVSYLLRDTPDVVAASNGELMRVTPSCLQRTLGRLAEHLLRIKVVLPDGQQQELQGNTALAEARSSNAVITEMTFQAESAENLWMERTSLHYPGLEHFTKFVNTLFLDRRIPDQADLVLDAFTGRHDVPMVRVTIAGRSEESRAELEKIVGEALVVLPKELHDANLVVTEKYRASDVLKNIFSVAYGIPEDPEVETTREKLTTVSIQNGNQDEQNAFLGRTIGEINNGIGFHADDTGKIEKDLRLFKRLRISSQGGMTLSGKEFHSGGDQTPAPDKPTLQQATPEPSELTATVAPVMQRKGILGTLWNLFDQDPRITGFKGHIYWPKDGIIYDENAYQYATTSFPADQTRPFMVAYPQDVEDIQIAIQFAALNNKKVVARSGGHQYCGKSSGDSGTIVLSMNALNFVNDISEDLVDVGPGVHLHQLANHFQGRGLTIPHGECPMVCIGGHAQTGGYGHLLRSFGLTLDYVMELDIVLANGEMKTVRRPNGPPQTDDEFLFWGVLGGNAGSFGIVTRYRFQCIKAGDYPDSYGYSVVRRYDKSIFCDLMKEVQAWTQSVVDGTLPEGLDFMMSVESSFVSLLPPVLVVELLQTDAGPSDEPQLANEIARVIDIAEQAAELGVPFMHFKSMGKDSLANLSRSYVRDFPSTTWTGREFRFPYRKRLNCTSVALTDSFVTRFVDLLNRVVMRTDGDMDGIYLVFQMMFGGGQLKDSKHRSGTSIPRRDLVYAFVFDLFYDEGYEDKAKALQEEMKSVTVETGYSANGDEKLFWGSFGDTKMSDPDVQKCYYDDAGNYAKLQILKKRMDPSGRFGSSFSVQLPVE